MENGAEAAVLHMVPVLWWGDLRSFTEIPPVTLCLRGPGAALTVPLEASPRLHSLAETRDVF